MAIPATSRAAESIAAATRLGVMALTVADLARSVAFYEAAIGLHTLTRVGPTAALGVEDGRPLLTVTEQPGARQPTRPHTGLYHVALLLPSRDLRRKGTRPCQVPAPGLPSAIAPQG